MIRLRFRASNAAYSWGLAKIMRSPEQISHVDIVMQDGRLLGAHIEPGVDLDGNPIESGVAIRNWDYGNPVRTMDVLYPASPDRERAFHQTACACIGLPFDWTALCYFLAPYGYRRERDKCKGFFCSELMAFCLDKAGVSPFHGGFDQEAVTPRDLMTPVCTIWEPVLTLSEGGFWCR